MGWKHLSFPSGTRFVVTGGAGFIGSNLCEALLSLGCFVTCLDNLSAGKKSNIASFLSNPRFLFVQGDVRDYSLCEKVCTGAHYILHQAALGSVPQSMEDPLLYESTNVRGTFQMLEAARKANCRRFVYASSSAVYGDNPSVPLREDTHGHFLSPYALTKYVGEEYSRFYFSLYGLETIGLRYFNVFGKRQHPDGVYAAVIPNFIRSLLQKKIPVIYGDGKQSRDFTPIDNVIEANLRACLASSDAAGLVFNIACGASENLLTVYRILCDFLEVDIAPTFEPERPGDIRHSHADISLAKKILDYAPDCQFVDGVSLAIAWYRENLL